MCELTTVGTITSLALVAAGTAATAYGADQADKAKSRAADAEFERQRKLGHSADAVLAQTLQANQGKKTQTDAAAQTEARTKAYSQAAADAGNYKMPGVDTATANQEGANRVVSDAYKGQASTAAHFVRQQGASRAAMQGFDDALLNNSIFTQNRGYDIQKLGSFMAGSAAVLPYELDSAGHKGDTSKTIGGVLQALGAVTGAGAASGAFAGAAGASKNALAVAKAAQLAGAAANAYSSKAYNGTTTTTIT